MPIEIRQETIDNRTNTTKGIIGNLKSENQIEKVLKLLPLQNISDIYENLDPRRKPFITPHFLTDEQYVERWLSFKYESKPGYDEGLTHTTDRGEKVRSKSEKIIADKLYALGIPYRYEYPVHIKGYGTVYIDFVILDVKTRKEIYYEHFGKMDDPDYINKNLWLLVESGCSGKRILRKYSEPCCSGKGSAGRILCSIRSGRSACKTGNRKMCGPLYAGCQNSRYERKKQICFGGQRD